MLTNVWVVQEKLAIIHKFRWCSELPYLCVNCNEFGQLRLSESTLESQIENVRETKNCKCHTHDRNAAKMVPWIMLIHRANSQRRDYAWRKDQALRLQKKLLAGLVLTSTLVLRQRRTTRHVPGRGTAHLQIKKAIQKPSMQHQARFHSVAEVTKETSLPFSTSHRSACTHTGDWDDMCLMVRKGQPRNLLKAGRGLETIECCERDTDHVHLLSGQLYIL